MNMRFDTITYKNNRLIIIDQRLLPVRLKKIEARNIKDVYSYIKSLAVRGAPAIGVFAAYGVLIGVRNIKTNDKRQFFKELTLLAGYLKKSRPTAVNLFWALDRMLKTADENYTKSFSRISSISFSSTDFNPIDRTCIIFPRPYSYSFKKSGISIG